MKRNWWSGSYLRRFGWRLSRLRGRCGRLLQNDNLRRWLLLRLGNLVGDNVRFGSCEKREASTGRSAIQPEQAFRLGHLNLSDRIDRSHYGKLAIVVRALIIAEG